jgi:hypothetical protein
LYRPNAKIACPISRFFLKPPHLAAPARAAAPQGRPGPAQPRIIPAGRPSLQVAAWQMIATAGNADFC